MRKKVLNKGYIFHCDFDGHMFTGSLTMHVQEETEGYFRWFIYSHLFVLLHLAGRYGHLLTVFLFVEKRSVALRWR